MPELPDVQVIREYLDATALHRKIEGARVDEPEMLEGVPCRELQARLRGREFEDTRRHGKYLFAAVGDRRRRPRRETDHLPFP